MTSMTDLRREIHCNFLIARALCTGSKATLAPDISPQRNVDMRPSLPIKGKAAELPLRFDSHVIQMPDA